MFSTNVFGWNPFGWIFPRRVHVVTGGAVNDLTAGGDAILAEGATGGAVNELIAGGGVVFIRTIFGGGRPRKKYGFPIRLPKFQRIKYPDWVTKNDDDEVLEILLMEEE
jgi:hypothetical protein